MTQPLAITLHASGAETLSGTGAAIDTAGTGATAQPRRRASKILLEVSAASGTEPRLTVDIETSPAATGPWVKVGGFAEWTTTGFGRTHVAHERYVRAKWTIAGTSPSFTIALTGEAHVVYAELDDLPDMGPPAKVLAAQADATKVKALIAATDQAAGRIAPGHVMPLVSWGDDLRRVTADIAAWDLVFNRGFVPDPKGRGADETFEKRYKYALEWLAGVADGSISPPEIVDQTPEAEEGSFAVASYERRGWGEA